MTKTFADMTAEEREKCVGMWALIEGINLAVIVEADETDTCVVVYPEWQSNTAVHLNEMVIPRYDLPRAWTPDGQPELAQALAEETWEYAVQVHREGRWQFYIGESRLPTDKPGLANGFSQKNHAQEFAKLEGEYPTRIVCRRVSPVEVISD